MTASGSDLSVYRGTGQAGPAYWYMFEHDSHAPGSVDRALYERMVRLCAETAPYLYSEYTPAAVEYQQGTRPELERHARALVEMGGPKEPAVEAIAEFCAGLEMPFTEELDFLWGGTEEDIVRRGSYNCTDTARVACVLFQIAGMSARLVTLLNTGEAYSGHQIVEVHRSGRWGAVDPTANVTYRHADRSPASAWELVNEPALIEANRSHDGAIYSWPDQFRFVAVCNYPVEDREGFDYATSGTNDYYRSILSKSYRGWPGGMRWLRGEDAGEEEGT